MEKTVIFLEEKLKSYKDQTIDIKFLLEATETKEEKLINLKKQLDSMQAICEQTKIQINKSSRLEKDLETFKAKLNYQNKEIITLVRNKSQLENELNELKKNYAHRNFEWKEKLKEATGEKAFLSNLLNAKTADFISSQEEIKNLKARFIEQLFYS